MIGQQERVQWIQVRRFDEILGRHVQHPGNLRTVHVPDVGDLQSSLEVGVRPVDKPLVVIALLITLDGLAFSKIDVA